MPKTKRTMPKTTRYAYDNYRVYATSRGAAANALCIAMCRDGDGPCPFNRTGKIKELPLEQEPYEYVDGRAAPGA